MKDKALTVRPKTIIFDFDGVIVDSNRIKKEGYYHIFSSVKFSEDVIGETIAKFKNTTRFVIIEKIVEGLLKGKLLKLDKNREELVKGFVDDYTKLVDNSIIESETIKGMRNLIERLSKTASLYINSGTPISSLLKIVKSRALDKYFVDILGYPPSKGENLHNIIKKNHLNPRDILCISDSLLDYEIAKENKASFIFFKHKLNNAALGTRDANELEDMIVNWIDANG